MRIMGIDYGDKRVGIALSDPLGLMAQGLKTLPNKVYDKMLESIFQIIKEYDVNLIVLGLPKNMNGTIGPRAESVMAFAEALKEKIDVPIHFWDERLSTVEAHKTMIDAGMSRSKRKNKVDSVAAVLILQGFLDFKGR
jgi:putative Holliday junction resolvase